MNRVDLHVYRDKIKKLNKAVAATETAYYDFVKFQADKIINGSIGEPEFDTIDKFFETHPELLDSIEDINKKLKRLSDN